MEIRLIKNRDGRWGASRPSGTIKDRTSARKSWGIASSASSDAE